VLIEAGERSPALRPLLDWLRENQHLAGWAAVVFMLVFFAVEQVEALGSDAHLKLPPGSVLYVPNRGDTSTVTIKIEKSGGSTP
jgi:hypothetical protein